MRVLTSLVLAAEHDPSSADLLRFDDARRDKRCRSVQYSYVLHVPVLCNVPVGPEKSKQKAFKNSLEGCLFAKSLPLLSLLDVMKRCAARPPSQASREMAGRWFLLLRSVQW
jgi:hypothetical protein